MGLRDYQTEATRSILEALQTHRSTLCVMATGLGKTRVFSEIAAGWKGGVLVLCHRQELITQAERALREATGEYIGIEQAHNQGGYARIVVASIDTIRQDHRLQRFYPNRFNLVIVDEAHHYVAGQYRKPIDYFTDAKVLGVTATPQRHDKKALGRIFDSVASNIGIEEGIDQGYLVPIVAESVPVEGLDLSDMKLVAGDLPAGILDSKVRLVCHTMVADLQAHAAGRQVIGFFPGVISATYAAELWNRTQPDTAEVITGETEPDVRATAIGRYKRGELRALMNCGVLTEGFDAPNTSIIAVCRPTLSTGLYTQIVGRGTRCHASLNLSPHSHDAAQRKAAIAASPKPFLRLRDYVGTGGAHSLVGIQDILGGSYSKEERKEAAKSLQNGEEVDVSKTLKAARDRIRAQAQNAGTLSGTIQHVAFDPFKSFGVTRRPTVSGREKKPPTLNQLAHLTRLGVPEHAAHKLSFREASDMLDVLIARKKSGLCTYKQADYLTRKGVQFANRLTIEQAHEKISQLIGGP